MDTNDITKLESVRGSLMMTVSVSVEPKMRKTDNPYYGKVRKNSRYNGQVNFHYDPAVIRQLEKEGKSPDCFRKGESWHEPVIREDGTLTPFCQHKKNGKRYLRFRILNTIDSEYVDDNNNRIEKSELEKYLQESGGYANQGTDNPVRIITVDLDNVTKIV